MQTTSVAPQWGALDSLVEVRPSRIHGLGLFARRPISKGAAWWQPSLDNVMLLNQLQLESLMTSRLNPAMESLLTLTRIYGYYSASLDRIIVCLDNARYVNHDPNPNSGAPPDGNPLCSVAQRDIRAGEEITENYAHYDICPWSDLTCSPEAR
jgi:SET domain-containing protein